MSMSPSPDIELFFQFNSHFVFYCYCYHFYCKGRWKWNIVSSFFYSVHIRTTSFKDFNGSNLKPSLQWVSESGWTGLLYKFISHCLSLLEWLKDKYKYNIFFILMRSCAQVINKNKTAGEPFNIKRKFIVTI